MDYIVTGCSLLNDLIYADGRWREYSLYGEAYDAYTALASLIRAPYLRGLADEQTKGVYFESAVDEFIWRELELVRALAPNAKLMWELPPWDIDLPEKHRAIFDIIDKVDLYSLNLPEALALFGASDEQAALEAIHSIGKPCFFRLGERGSCMVQNGESWFAPAVGLERSLDPTGCGNCSTGSALFGYCEGFHPLKTAIAANLAAGLNARQYGPFPQFTPRLRVELLQQADELFERRIGEV